MTITNKGKPENRKRKLSDADPQSSEEETTTVAVATEKIVADKKKNKQKDKKAQKGQKGKPVHEEPEVEDEDNSDEAEGATAGVSTQRLKETPKSKSGAGSVASSSKDVDRRDERDRRTLFFKNLPGNCTIRHIKALSKDIKQVRLRTTFSVIDNKRTRIAFAYVSFANEDAAEKNFKTLEATVIRGTKITVDYVGEKSKFQSTKSKKEPATIDPLRLYVSGLPGNATEEDMLKLFPGAVEIVMPKRNKDKLLFGYAFIGFDDADLAAKYHGTCQDLTLNGRKLVVLYAKSRAGGSGKTSEKQKQKGAKVAAKQEVKMDDDDDDEEDDDEEEDEDDDDDDDE